MLRTRLIQDFLRGFDEKTKKTQFCVLFQGQIWQGLAWSGGGTWNELRFLFLGHWPFLYISYCTSQVYLTQDTACAGPPNPKLFYLLIFSSLDSFFLRTLSLKNVCWFRATLLLLILSTGLLAPRDILSYSRRASYSMLFFCSLRSLSRCFYQSEDS